LIRRSGKEGHNKKGETMFRLLKNKFIYKDYFVAKYSKVPSALI
jgi:hypothetical protein